MKMNILDILHTLGWKIISADNFKQIYVITQSSERLARAQEVARKLMEKQNCIALQRVYIV